MGKNNKKKKTVNPAVVNTLKRILFGCFSNDRAIEGAKKAPWWVAVIIFIVSIILPIVPITVSAAKKYGSEKFKSLHYELDTMLTDASITLNNDKISLKLNDDRTLEAYKNSASIDDDYTKEKVLKETSFALVNHNNLDLNLVTLPVFLSKSYATKPLYSYFKFNENKEITLALNIYYVSEVFSTKDMKSLVEDISEKEKYVQRNLLGNPVEPGDFSLPVNDKDNGLMETSFVIFTKNFFYYSVYHNNLSSRIVSEFRNWKSTPKGVDLIERTLKNVKNPTVTNREDCQEVFKGWKQIFDETYISQRNRSTLLSTFIYLGIYFVLVWILGLMLFLMTRGKANPFSYLTYWTCCKIAFWIALAPGLLSLILGFVIPNYAMMYFVVLMGLRAFWLSTKQLRPIQQ